MKEKDNWQKCPKCGHKLFKKIDINDDKNKKIIEIKCHSCKKITLISL